MPNRIQIQELNIILTKRREDILKSIDNTRNNIDQLKSQEINDELDYAEVSSDSFTDMIDSKKLRA